MKKVPFILFSLVLGLIILVGCGEWLAKQKAERDDAKKQVEAAKQDGNKANAKQIACNDTLELKDIVRAGIVPKKEGLYTNYSFDTSKVSRLAPDFNAQNLLTCYRRFLNYPLSTDSIVLIPQYRTVGRPQEKEWDIRVYIKGRLIDEGNFQYIQGSIIEANGLIRSLIIAEFSTDIDPNPTLSIEQAAEIVRVCKGCNTLFGARIFASPCKTVQPHLQEPVYFYNHFDKSTNNISALAYKFSVNDYKSFSWDIYINAHTGVILFAFPTTWHFCQSETQTNITPELAYYDTTDKTIPVSHCNLGTCNRYGLRSHADGLYLRAFDAPYTNLDSFDTLKATHYWGAGTVPILQFSNITAATGGAANGGFTVSADATSFSGIATGTNNATATALTAGLHSFELSNVEGCTYQAYVGIPNGNYGSELYVLDTNRVTCYKGGDARIQFFRHYTAETAPLQVICKGPDSTVTAYSLNMNFGIQRYLSTLLGKTDSNSLQPGNYVLVVSETHPTQATLSKTLHIGIAQSSTCPDHSAALQPAYWAVHQTHSLLKNPPFLVKLTDGISQDVSPIIPIFASNNPKIQIGLLDNISNGLTQPLGSAGNILMRLGFNGSTDNYPYTSLDIVAHEYAHGINYAGINYYIPPGTEALEGGALGEGFCDIIGVVIEANEKPIDWQIGEMTNSSQIPFRHFADPKSIGKPKAYQKTNWAINSTQTIDGNGVLDDYKYHNATVLGHWFYLLVNGAENIHVDDNPTLTLIDTIPALGVDTAMRIVMRAFTFAPDGLTTSPTFVTACQATLNAANTLFPANSSNTCSRAVRAVKKAWEAVGVTCPLPAGVTCSLCTPPPTPTFDITAACGTGNTGSISITNPLADNTYLWSNGATTQNISGLAAGTYSVTVSNAAGCSSTAEAVVQNQNNCASANFTATNDCFGNIFDASTNPTVCAFAKIIVTDNSINSGVITNRTWSFDGGIATPISGSGNNITAFEVVWTSPGTHTIQLTIAANAGIDIIETTIQKQITIATNNGCIGSSNMSVITQDNCNPITGVYFLDINMDGATATNYTIIDNSNNSIANQGGITTDYIQLFGLPNNYTIIISDANNCIHTISGNHACEMSPNCGVSTINVTCADGLGGTEIMTVTVEVENLAAPYFYTFGPITPPNLDAGIGYGNIDPPSINPPFALSYLSTTEHPFPPYLNFTLTNSVGCTLSYYIECGDTIVVDLLVSTNNANNLPYHIACFGEVEFKSQNPFDNQTIPCIVKGCAGEPIELPYFVISNSNEMGISSIWCANPTYTTSTQDIINGWYNDNKYQKGKFYWTPSEANIGENELLLYAQRSDGCLASRKYKVIVEELPPITAWQTQVLKPLLLGCDDDVVQAAQVQVIPQYNAALSACPPHFTVNGSNTDIISLEQGGNQTIVINYGGLDIPISVFVPQTQLQNNSLQLSANIIHANSACGDDACNGEVSIGVSGSGSGSYTYAWSDYCVFQPHDPVSGGMSANTSGTPFGGGGSDTPDCVGNWHGNLCSGIYSVTVTDTQTGCTAVANFNIGLLLTVQGNTVLTYTALLDEPRIRLSPTLFDNTTRVNYDLPEDAFVTIKAYNLQGVLVKTLVDDEYREAGSYELNNEAGEFNNGLYLFSLEVCDRNKTQIGIKY
jgi:hypothetical protein